MCDKIAKDWEYLKYSRFSILLLGTLLLCVLLFWEHGHALIVVVVDVSPYALHASSKYWRCFYWICCPYSYTSSHCLTIFQLKMWHCFALCCGFVSGLILSLAPIQITVFAIFSFTMLLVRLSDAPKMLNLATSSCRNNEHFLKFHEKYFH